MYKFNKDSYDNLGYQIFKPNIILNKKEIDKIDNFFDQIFLNYEDNVTYKSSDWDFTQDAVMRNNVNYIGYSEKQILFRAKNKYHKEIENDNILYGKRAVSDIRNIDNPIVKLVENDNLVNLAKYLLKVDEVVVLMGGFTQTYPGSLGEGNRIHADSSGINNYRRVFDLFDKKINCCNIHIYTTDVNPNNAPMKILPNSHLKIKEYSREVSKHILMKPNNQFFPQASEVFQEIIPQNNYVSLEVEKGSVVAFDINTLHAATKCLSDKNIRRITTVVYGPKNEGLLKVGYSKGLRNKPFYKHIKNKSLFKYNTFDYITAKNKVNFIRNKIISLLFKFKNKNLNNNSNHNEIIFNEKYLNLSYKNDFYEKKFKNVDLEKIFEKKLKINSLNFLPIKDNSIKFIYSVNLFEKLMDKDLKKLLNECYRILNKDGSIRFVVKNIDIIFKNYEEKNMSFFNWCKNDKFFRSDSWLRLISRFIAEPILSDFNDNELYGIYKNKKNYLDFCEYLTKHQEKKFKDIKSRNHFLPFHNKNYFYKKKIEKYLKISGFKNIVFLNANQSKYFYNVKNFERSKSDLNYFVECSK